MVSTRAQSILRPWWLHVIGLAFVIVLSPAIGWAQSAATATLIGSVVDESGAAVPAATVTLLNPATSAERQVVSDERGAFAFLTLAPGLYTLRVTLSGFTPVSLEAVQLQVGDTRSVRVTLRVQAVEATVTVAGAGRRGTPSQSTVVDAELVERQPLNGRGFQTLLELAPGVVIASTDVTTGGTFSVNGQRTGSNVFQVDGVSANFATTAALTPYQSSGGGLPSLSAQGGTNTLASIDAVQEFAVETSSYAPEFGRQAGAQVTIVTRAGTNAFHGSAFEFFRDDALDAADFFANAANLPKAELSQHNFGATFSGPLVRNRAFFFGTYEGLRLRQPITSAPYDVPSLAARQAATGRAAALLNAFPLPTSAPREDAPDTATFIGTFSNPSSLDAASLRVDGRLNERWTIFARYNRGPSEIQERAYFATPNTISFREYLTETLTGGLTLVGRTFTNDLRLNVSRARAGDRYEIDDFGGAVVPPTSALLPSFANPETDLGLAYIGAGDSGLYLGRNSRNRQRQLQIVNVTIVVRGGHTVKFGLDYRRLDPRGGDAPRYESGLFFDTPTDLLNDTVPFFFAATVTENLTPVYHNLSLFAQDAWRTARATITFGLRWDLSPAPSAGGATLPWTVGDLDGPAGPELRPPGTRYFETSYGDVAPRVGFTYLLAPERGTVLKGGTGVFFDLPYTFTGSGLTPGAYPFGNDVIDGPIPLSGGLVDAPVPPPSLAPPYGRMIAYDDDARTPYTVQWSVGAEQELGSRGSLSVAYVGAAGRRLGRVESLRDLFADFTRLDIVRTIAASDYHSLQLQYRVNAGQGMHALVSYTLGHSTDTVSNESISNFQAPLGAYDPEQDRGPSDCVTRLWAR